MQRSDTTMAYKSIKWSCPLCGIKQESEIGRGKIFKAGDELVLTCDECSEASCFEVHETGIQFMHKVTVESVYREA